MRLDGRESEENANLKKTYGPVIPGNVQNRIVSPSGENLDALPIDYEIPELADYLRVWAERFPGKESSSKEATASRRPLPYFATLHQALNVAACDARPLVLVISSTTEEREAVEALARPLAWSDEFVGCFHFVNSFPDDHSLSELDGMARKPEAGLYLITPDEFGMHGTLFHHVPRGGSPDGLADKARDLLSEFAGDYEKRSLVEKFQRHTTIGARDWIYRRQAPIPS